MKKILIALLFSQLMWAQEAYNPNDNVFNKSQAQQNTQADENAADPGGNGLGGTDTSPIDNYIPALAIVGFGMAVYFSRNKYGVIHK